MSSSKLNRIKIWSLGDDISSAIIPYDLNRINLNNPVYIDFENVKKVSSSGISIILAKIVKLIKKHPNVTWIPYFGEENIKNLKIKNFLSNIGVMKIFDEEIMNKDLFFSDYSQKEEFETPRISQISYPVYRIRNSECHDRNNVEELIVWLDDKLFKYLEGTNFRIEIFARMIKEMAKNSYDHTDNDAFLGMDLIRKHKNKYSLKFSFSDLGPGIHENIKKFCSDKGDKNTHKFGLTTTYYKAFSIGISSRKNKYNKGYGMSIIQECSSVLNFDLCIFDARSMAIVPPILTNKSIRDSFCDTKNPVGFGYYGEILIN